uniref:Deoxyribonuclease n=1 Tax=uncultured Bacillota bacterium TaxID=344338 RepID=A0A650EPP2_9FIRM|nr:deoxyribonuclease [uncultured Firmicutes bacterium]
MLYDSHAHLDDPQFDGDREAVIQKIKSAGVGYLNNIGADMKTSAASINLAEENDFIYATVGVHPSETTDMTDSDIEELRRMAAHPKVVAIGEIGLDYHYEDTNKELQRKWFRRQLELAKELELPVVIHDRESGGECIAILKEMGITNGVMHCYSGSAETAKELLDMGFHISFTGVLTFKNAKKAVQAVSVIPMERLMIETDCPYMAPEPYRGTRNDSSYVGKVAEKMAEIKGLSVEEVERITCENAKRFFKVSDI